ncbi:MAG: hypothetical protein WC796_01925 [Candidatus Pacearchaeota archaeon]|jgi:hypothetical protein
METEKPKNWFKKHKIITGFLIFFVLIWLIGSTAYIFGYRSENSQQTSYNSNTQSSISSTSPSIGEEGRLYSNGQDTLVAVDKASLDELTHAFTVKDTIGAQNMVLDGRAFFVKSNTKILVLDSDFAVREFRILEGDNYEKVGWAPKEWIIKG